MSSRKSWRAKLIEPSISDQKGLKTLQKFISFKVEWIWLLDFSPKSCKSNKSNISSGKNGFSELIWNFFMNFWKVYNLLSVIVDHFRNKGTTAAFDLKFSPVIGIDHMRRCAKFQVTRSRHVVRILQRGVFKGF